MVARSGIEPPRESNVYQNMVDFTSTRYFTWRVSDCEELVGEVNHTTEYVTDLFEISNLNLMFI